VFSIMLYGPKRRIDHRKVFRTSFSYPERLHSTPVSPTSDMPSKNAAIAPTKRSPSLKDSHPSRAHGSFLQQKIDVIDSQRRELLIWSLKCHQQSAKRNIRLATNQLAFISLHISPPAIFPPFKHFLHTYIVSLPSPSSNL
jgi:hypothetical protein